MNLISMSDISSYHFTNRQDSGTVQRTVRKSKIRGGSEFEFDTGRSDVGLRLPNTFDIFINDILLVSLSRLQRLGPF